MDFSHENVVKKRSSKAEKSAQQTENEIGTEEITTVDVPTSSHIKSSVRAAKRKRSSLNSIQVLPVTSELADSRDPVDSSSPIEALYEATTSRDERIQLCQEEIVASADEQYTPHVRGLSSNLLHSTDETSCSESESSYNDRSSDEDFNSTAKRRKVGSVASCYSETEDDDVDRCHDYSNEDSYRVFECDICGRRFPKDWNLQRHKLVHTDKKPFICEICGQCFSLEENYQAHQRAHTSDTPFECPVCAKCFTRKLSLQTHMRLHTGDAPFKCSVCEKSFKQKGNLQTHLRIHSGETPYACSICKKSFSDGATYSRHKLTHTGEKSFKCEICRKSFLLRSGLQAHHRTHTEGEQPFGCSSCDKRFTLKQSLQKHEKRFHSGQIQSFECNMCHASFKKFGFFQRHMHAHIAKVQNASDL